MIDIFADLRTRSGRGNGTLTRTPTAFKIKRRSLYLNAVTTPLGFIIDNHTAFQLSHAEESSSAATLIPRTVLSVLQPQEPLSDGDGRTA